MAAFKWLSFLLLIGLITAWSYDDEDSWENPDEEEYDDGKAADEKRFISMSGFRERTNGKNPFFKWLAKPMKRRAPAAGITWRAPTARMTWRAPTARMNRRDPAAGMNRRDPAAGMNWRHLASAQGSKRGLNLRHLAFDQGTKKGLNLRQLAKGFGNRIEN